VRDCYVGATVLPFFGIFGSLIGDPDVVVPPYRARILQFPRRATNELAELIVSGPRPAGDKREVVGV
jgi:hypothetical protein